MQKYVDTNLSFEEILTLGNFGMQLERENFKMVMLPGKSTSEVADFRSYWIVDEVGRDRVMSQFFKINPDLTLTQLRRRQSQTSRDSNDRRLPRDLKIFIQNASNNPKAATSLAGTLLDQGFNSVSVMQDWPDKQRYSQIIVQRGDFAAADILKRALGGGQIEATSTGEIASDLTIRIGEDWANR
jgi:hypothetical protein